MVDGSEAFAGRSRRALEFCEYGCDGGEWSGKLVTLLGEVAESEEPHLVWVFENVATASSGSSIFHFDADMQSIRSVRRAQVQHSPISSKCLTP